MGTDSWTSAKPYQDDDRPKELPDRALMKPDEKKTTETASSSTEGSSASHGHLLRLPRIHAPECDPSARQLNRAIVRHHLNILITKMSV